MIVSMRRITQARLHEIKEYTYARQEVMRGLPLSPYHKNVFERNEPLDVMLELLDSTEAERAEVRRLATQLKNYEKEKRDASRS